VSACHRGNKCSDRFRDAVRAARIGGRVVLVGIPDGDVLHPSGLRRRAGAPSRSSSRGAWATSTRGPSLSWRPERSTSSRWSPTAWDWTTLREPSEAPGR
jgi:hypothetical protein